MVRAANNAINKFSFSTENHKSVNDAIIDYKQKLNEHIIAEYNIQNPDELTGFNIIIKSIEAPLRTIVENAGGEGSVVIAKVTEGTNDFGFNAKTGEYVQMLAAGIIDPKKVTRVALENAASVAGMILTTECALIDIKEDTPAMPMGGGMPGMM